ncbi:MAG: hypothetical protein ABFS19_14580, partial [Thermodesulfobacteriota bacterium]
IFCAGSLTMEGREGFWLFDVEENTLTATPGLWNGGSYELKTTAAVSNGITKQKQFTGAENGKK